MEEVWKDIAGYEGLYQVSTLGRVKSFWHGKEKILKPWINNKGYSIIGIGVGDNQKRFLVHRLVAQTFTPNTGNKLTVNHKDGNTLNNCVENLEWATYSENNQHAYDTGLKKSGEECSWARLSNEEVRLIRDNPGGLTQRQLAALFNIDKSSVGDIQLGKIRRSAGGTIRGKQKQNVPERVRAQIRNEYKPHTQGCGCRVLAKKFGVDQKTIMRIVKEK